MVQAPLVGMSVKVLEPFTDDFPDIYEITEVVTHDDGQVACILAESGAFAPQYLEIVE